MRCKHGCRVLLVGLIQLAISLSGITAAVAQTIGFPAVSAGEQATRDDERLRILRDELANEKAAAAEAVKRRAERLTAGDPHGVQEAEQAQARHADNIAALRREIDAAHSQARAAKAQPTRVQATARRSPARTGAEQGGPVTPWWDVYGKPPRRSDTAPQPVSWKDSPSAAPSVAPAAAVAP
jgi:hypothetical protein